MIVNKKVIRTIKENKTKYVGAIILIILSCMLFIGFNIASPNIVHGLKDYRDRNKIEDANFILNSDLENEEKIKEEYNVLLEKRKSFDYDIDENRTVRILSQSKEVNSYEVISGDDLKNNDEIILDENFAKANDYEIGDSIELEDNTFKVVGYYVEPDYTYIIKSDTEILPNAKKFGVGMLTDDAYEKLIGDKASTYYSIVFSDDNKDEFKEYLNKNNIVLSWMDRDNNTKINFVDNEMNAFVKMGYIVPIFILLITCLLISIVISRLLKSEFIQIGTLNALGYRKKEILNHYLRFPLFISIVGSAISIIPGAIFSKVIGKLFLAKYSLPAFKVDFSNSYMIFIGIIMPFVFLIPTTVIVVKKALKLSPLELMHNGKSNSKKGLIEGKIKLDKWKFANKFIMRDLLRNIPRSLLMIFGITFSSLLILFGFTTINSINNLVDDNYNNVYKYEYNYIFKNIQKENVSDADKLNFGKFNLVSNSKEKEDITVYGINENAQNINIKTEAGTKIDFSKIVITKTLADKLNVKAGSNVTVNNSVNSEKFEIKIDEIADTYIGDYVYMPLDKFNSECGFEDESYRQLLSKNELNYDEDSILTCITKDVEMDNYANLINTIKMLVIAVWVVAIFISIVIVAIVSSLLIEENRLNISLFKILGYRKKEIFDLTLKNNIILVVIGYLLAIPLILILVRQLFDILMNKMSIVIPANINISSCIVGFIVIYIAYKIATYICKKDVLNVSMVEILKERNE